MSQLIKKSHFNLWCDYQKYQITKWIQKSLANKATTDISKFELQKY